jgi:subfamily B ATP-binding cassette protein MsbA
MRSLLRLKPYLRPHLWTIILSAAMAFPLSALRVGPAPLIKYMEDDVLIKHDMRMLVWLPVAVIALYILNFFVRFIHYYSIRVVVSRTSQKLKNDLFEHLLGLSADYFTAQSTGTLISRVAYDVTYVEGGISAINTIVREPITLVLLAGYAAYLNWRLLLLTLVVIPALAYIFSATGRNLKRYIARITEANALLFSSLQESFTGIRVVKTFGLEKYVSRKFRERNETYTKFLLKTAVLEEASHPMVELLFGVAIALLLYYGGSQVFSNKMTPGDFLAFCVAFAMLVNPLRMMNEVNVRLNQASAACSRIFEVLDWKPKLHEPDNPLPISQFREGIELRDVSFAYPDMPERPVLSNISFTIPRGQTVALVGPSGAGKSSLVGLIPRIFDVTGGSIHIDGHDVRELELEDLRKLIAVVSQDVFLFNDTIEENIRCGRLSATREEVKEAARKAHAADFIQSIPGDYQAVIGDRGQKLSGGERQRISIARAFLREAPILILDEATSSLDTQSERAVQAALEELMKNRTTLIIAHRLSTIRNADRILVVKDGRVIEEGRHEELLKLRGEYAQLYGGAGAGTWQ